jgi:hypothetical protein
MVDVTITAIAHGIRHSRDQAATDLVPNPRNEGDSYTRKFHYTRRCFLTYCGAAAIIPRSPAKT